MHQLTDYLPAEEALAFLAYLPPGARGRLERLAVEAPMAAYQSNLLSYAARALGRAIKAKNKARIDRASEWGAMILSECIRKTEEQLAAHLVEKARSVPTDFRMQKFSNQYTNLN